MQMRMVTSVLVGACLIVVSARPALAQARVDFAAGYSFLRVLEDAGPNVPTGWGASFAVGKSERIKFVGDVSGHYNDSGSGSLHMFQGGVEIARKHQRVVPFVRLLAGATSFSGEELVFVFTPEVGVKIMGTDRVGVQITGGFPYLTNGDGSLKMFRLFAGIVIRK